MAPSNHDDFDGYRKWLGISNKKRPPTHYELLSISLDEDDPEVIHAAAEQRRHFVESKRGEPPLNVSVTASTSHRRLGRKQDTRLMGRHWHETNSTN